MKRAKTLYNDKGAFKQEKYWFLCICFCLLKLAIKEIRGNIDRIENTPHLSFGKAALKRVRTSFIGIRDFGFVEY